MSRDDKEGEASAQKWSLFVCSEGLHGRGEIDLSMTPNGHQKRGDFGCRLPFVMKINIPQINWKIYVAIGRVDKSVDRNRT